MNPHRIRRGLLVAATPTLFGILGCSIATRSTPKFSHHFAPPAVRSEETRFAIEEPPQLNLFAKEQPLRLAAGRPLPPRTVEIDLRIGRAEALFQAGSDLLVKGRQDEARIEFDRALELLAEAPVSLPDRARLVKKYEEMVEAIHRLEVDASGSGADSEPVAVDRSPLEEVAGMTFPTEPGLKGKVREQLEATVSQLPLEMADPVLSYINYFSSRYGKAQLEYGLRRSGRYAAMIRRILDEEGLPQELIYLAQAESAFLPRAVSRMAAVGMWQFIKATGAEYGLTRTAHTEDRFDPEKATRAAAKHLRDLHAAFGDWYLAIAAYNCGPYTVERAVQRTGYADFWELYKRNVLPRETASYLPIILAITIMTKNPKDYGLEGIVPDPQLDYDTIELNAPTHVALLADLAHKPLQTIREMNPAILKLIVPAGYPVHVPKGSGASLMARLESIPRERRMTWRIHRVNPSETVAAIARQYRTTEKSIADANGGGAALDPSEGDVILIPVSYPGPPPEPARRVTTRRGAHGTLTAAKRTGTGAVRQSDKKQALAPASVVRGPQKRTGTGAVRQSDKKQTLAPASGVRGPQKKPATATRTQPAKPVAKAPAKPPVKQQAQKPVPVPARAVSTRAIATVLKTR